MIQTLILLWLIGSGLHFVGKNSSYKRLLDDCSSVAAVISIFLGQGLFTILGYGFGYLVTSVVVFWMNYF